MKKTSTFYLSQQDLEHTEVFLRKFYGINIEKIYHSFNQKGSLPSVDELAETIFTVCNEHLPTAVNLDLIYSLCEPSDDFYNAEGTLSEIKQSIVCYAVLEILLLIRSAQECSVFPSINNFYSECIEGVSVIDITYANYCQNFSKLFSSSCIFYYIFDIVEKTNPAKQKAYNKSYFIPKYLSRFLSILTQPETLATNPYRLPLNYIDKYSALSKSHFESILQFSNLFHHHISQYYPLPDADSARPNFLTEKADFYVARYLFDFFFPYRSVFSFCKNHNSEVLEKDSTQLKLMAQSALLPFSIHKDTHINLLLRHLKEEHSTELIFSPKSLSGTSAFKPKQVDNRIQNIFDYIKYFSSVYLPIYAASFYVLLSKYFPSLSELNIDPYNIKSPFTEKQNEELLNILELLLAYLEDMHLTADFQILSSNEYETSREECKTKIKKTSKEEKIERCNINNIFCEIKNSFYNARPCNSEQIMIYDELVKTSTLNYFYLSDQQFRLISSFITHLKLGNVLSVSETINEIDAILNSYRP